MKKESTYRQFIFKNTLTTLLLSSSLALFGASAVNAEETAFDDAKVMEILDEVVEIEELIGPKITRHQGYSRENVAESVAKAHFSDANKVIIVNREKYPDAISATNISQGRYPVLYTHAHTVSESTIELLKTMDLDQVYVLGGTLSVNESVVSELTNKIGVKVTRLAGRSRYDANSSAIAANYKKKDHVVIASGEVFADALYGVSYANTINAPVVLTKTNNLEDSTVKLLKDLGVKTATIIGGELTVTKAVEDQLRELGINPQRIAGRNRYIGSAEVAAASYENPTQAVIASGEVFSDALVSAPLAQKLNAPILLVRSDSMENPVRDYLNNAQMSLKDVYIQGGPVTITESNENRVKELSSYLTSTQVIPFETITLEDDTLPEGKLEMIQEGKPGEELVYYNYTYEDEELVKKSEIKRDILSTPVTEIISLGTLVMVEDIELSHTDFVLIQGDTTTITATVLPENSTNKELSWSSSDEDVVTVDEDGNVEAQNIGEATISVTNSTGTIVSEITVTVNPIKIDSIDDIVVSLTQYDDFELPQTVQGYMNNGTVTELTVDWSDVIVDTSSLGTHEFEGIVEGYDEPVKLTLTVEEYDPQLYPYISGKATVNGVVRSLSITINNRGIKPVDIEKIEVYERGKLVTTYTTDTLKDSGIKTTIIPNAEWGMSISYKVGIWQDGSSVKIYTSVNNNSFEDTLDL